jgi:putative membrane protein
MNKTKISIVLVGLAFIVYLFSEIGVAAVWERLSALGWNSVLIFLPYLLCNYIDTWAWIFTFPPPFSKYAVSFASVFWLRLCGEAVNNFTATAHVGGDFTRVYCLKYMGVPMTQGVVSVVMDKAALIISEILFIYTAILLLLIKMDWPASLKWAIASSLILVLIAIYGVLALVHKGIFSKIVEAIYSKWRWDKILKFYEGVKHLDLYLAQFYRDHWREFVRSNVWHYVGWLAGALETWTLLYLLNIKAGFVDALMIEGLMTLVKGLGFFIVGSLGIQEGGSVFLFHLLDLGLGTGLAFSMLKRTREIFYGLAGWIVFSVQFSGAKARESQAPLS